MRAEDLQTVPGEFFAHLVLVCRQHCDATYNLVAVRNVEVEVLDNDAPGLIVAETDGKTLVIEGSLTVESGFTKGIADTYTVRLAKAPAAGTTVTVKLAFDAAQLGLSLNSIVFDSTNWNLPVTITVTAADNSSLPQREDRKVSVITATIDQTAAGRDASFDNVFSQLDVDVLDDETPGVLVTESNGSTIGTKDGPTITDTYTVRLTKAPDRRGGNERAERRPDDHDADNSHLRRLELVDSADGDRRRRSVVCAPAWVGKREDLCSAAAYALSVARPTGDRRRSRRGAGIAQRSDPAR